MALTLAEDGRFIALLHHPTICSHRYGSIRRDQTHRIQQSVQENSVHGNSVHRGALQELSRSVKDTLTNNVPLEVLPSLPCAPKSYTDPPSSLFRRRVIGIRSLV